MNDQATQQTEFLFRRLAEPLSVGGKEVSPLLWLLVVIPVLVLGLFYVGWMYSRDSRSVPWYAAVPLGLLRAAVYLILAGVFLLPALQAWETAEKRSRVVLLIDVSDSLAKVSDLPPSESQPTDRLPTRLDQIVNFLTDEQVAFLKRLTEKNPVVAYRFGGRLDEESHTFTASQPAWTKAEWDAWLRLDLKQWLLHGLSPEGQAKVKATEAFSDEKPGNADWALAWFRRELTESVPGDLSEADRAKLLDNRAKLDKRVEVCRQLTSGTNLGESLLALVNRESNTLAQGIVVISDGRSNLGSESAAGEVRARARKEGIPVFTILVGEDRPPVGIVIADVQTPERVPPDEKFNVRAEIDGQGLPDQEVKVSLDLYPPKAEKPAHSLDTTVTFQPGEPPHAQAEFTLDPELLPADLRTSAPGKAELIEGEWKVVVRVPKHPREVFAAREHVSDPVVIQVVKKPLRVLLVAGGPMREYQFVRTMLNREKEAGRAELSVYLQNEGRDGRSVQDVEPERLLNRFPTTLRTEDDPNEKREERFYNLAQYDVIFAFDPDWNDFTPEQVKLLVRWIEDQGGGLVYIAGPVNTYQLARGGEGGMLKPLLDLIPVVPGDSVLATPIPGGGRRSTKLPFRLNFPGANPETEFLKLDDDKSDPLAGWEEFFTGQEDRAAGMNMPAKRGFFNVYPVTQVKPGAGEPIATFGDPLARGADGKEAPFLVAMKYGKGRSVFVAAGELWRLRQYREQFYERFWTKLGRYAAAGTRTAQSRRGTLVMGRQFSTGNYVRVEAQLRGPDLGPLPQSTRPKATLFLPTLEGTRDRKEFELTAKPSQGEWAGWFQGRVLVTQPGEYRLELPVPNSSDVLRGKLTVKESNPELDNTRPDPAALYAVAGDFEEIAGRFGTNKSALDDVRRRLRSTKPVGIGDQAERETVKLSFPDMRSADVIPQCMEVKTQKQRNRGPVDDLWDDGPMIAESNGEPIRVATILMVVVGLLSIEWLTRKLLRLA